MSDTNAETRAAARRVARFLEARDQASSVDPEFLLIHDGLHLRASDLRLLLAALEAQP